MDENPARVPIHKWAQDDQPREKLIHKGKESLSDAELLAVLLRSGSVTQSAVELGRTLLQKANQNLIELSKLSVDDLMRFKGIGEAKAVSIIAALELGMRRRQAEVPVRKTVSSSRDAFDLLYTSVADCLYEEFWILLLNHANRKISIEQISEGGQAGTVVDPKKVFKLALEQNAAGIILCHNHPSGNLTPSDADKKLTDKIKNAGNFLDIKVLDHLIIADENYFSFADNGLI
ncbi:MAG: DNA repair protein RadC [Lentimicrobium sp.]|nr:DNA repair protein RadC [Lentimicrobium sp.]